MKTWKKNMVAAAVLVTVCTGIYLNWIYSESQSAADLTQKLDAEKVLSDSLLILDGDSAPVSGDENTITDYFAAVRLSRQQARDSALEQLQEAMSYENADNSTSAAQLEQIVQMALSEAQIESLVIAKGYADCVAYMSEQGISVAVASPEGGMKDTDVALIADIVMTQTEYDFADIRVVEVQ